MQTLSSLLGTGYKKAFTVVELIIVITVIGILAAISIVAFNGVQQQTLDTSLLSDADKIAGLETDYAIDQQNGGKDWYSGDGTDTDLKFTPTSGNVIDVVTDSTDFCIRAFNPGANFDSVINAVTKGSTENACNKLPPSEAVLEDYPYVVNSTTVSGLPSPSWSYAASSADGSRLASVASDVSGSFYRTENGGQSWINTTSAAGAFAWSRVAMSDDGMTLFASRSNGYIFRSVDGGVTWTQQTGAGSRSWTGLSVSANGMVVVAHDSVSVYVSTNGGAVWTLRNPPGGPGNFYDVEVSNDASTIVLAKYGGYLYSTTNNGVTWVTGSSAGVRNWQGVTLSYDGKTMYAGVQTGDLYRSVDSGASWQIRLTSTTSWYRLSSSESGSVLARISGGYIHLSYDKGLTWLQQTSSGNLNWQGLAVSSDGTRVVGAASGQAPRILTIE